MGASLVPFALWLDGSVTLDRFSTHVTEHARALIWKDGHAFPAYPIALPLLVTPLYAPAALLVRVRGWNVEQVVVLAGILEKLVASLIAALSVGLFYLLSRRLTSGRRAILLALTYGFATETWVISSQALWQHGGSELATMAGLWSLLRAWQKPGDRLPLVAAGLSAAVALAIRPTNVLFLAAIVVWLLAARRGPVQWALFLMAPLAAGAATLAYNLHVFGRVTGGYAMELDGPFWKGLAGVLVSPGRGLLVYTPIALFSLLGVWALWRSREPRREPVYLVSGLFCVSQILLISNWRVWWGGHCFGPRLLTDIVPCLILLILPALDLISARSLVRTAFVAALAISTFVQAVGAFCYPNSGWDETPVSVGAHPGRLWDWSDSPILRSLSAGPRLGPAPESIPKLRRVF